jgi:hypothetical protein
VSEEKTVRIAEFYASLPVTRAGVSLYADDARVQLDVPLTDVDEATKMYTLGRERLLKVYVDVVMEPKG